MLEILIANGTIGKLNPCESQLEDHQRQIDELVAAAMAGGNDTHEGARLTPKKNKNKNNDWTLEECVERG